MHQSKLFTLLNSLKTEEIRWFRRFLKSPFHNTNEQYIELFNYIKKYYPELDSPKLSKEAACKKLFPKEVFNVQKIRKLMHGLTVLLEEFIIAMSLKNNAYQKKRLLVSQLGQRNVHELFKKGTEELIAELEGLPYRDAFYYQEMQVLNLEYYDHIETIKCNGGIHYLKAIVENLNRFYIVRSQRVNYAIKEYEKLYSHEATINSLEQSYCDLTQNPLFQLYQLIYKTLEGEPKEAIYLEIETLFKNEIESLPRISQLEILRILCNYWASFINKGQKEYASKMLTLYKFGLKHHLVIQNQQLGEVIFTNIVSCGVMEQDWDWVENFIQHYQQFLPDAIRENATRLSYGGLFFTKKEYDKVLDLISNHTFASPLHMIKSRTILIKTYFEKFLMDESYYDLLIAQNQSFEKYIRRNSYISDAKKEIYLNFTTFCRKVAHAILENTLDVDLSNKIKGTQKVILKFWLIEKIETSLKQQRLLS